MTANGEVRCSALGGMCMGRGLHAEHWWSSEQMIRDLGMTRGADGRLALREEVSRDR